MVVRLTVKQLCHALRHPLTSLNLTMFGCTSVRWFISSRSTFSSICDAVTGRSEENLELKLIVSWNSMYRVLQWETCFQFQISAEMRVSGLRWLRRPCSSSAL